MTLRNISIFALEAATVGIIAALALLYLLPNHQNAPGHVVELTKSERLPTTQAPVTGPVSYANAVKQAAPAVVNIFTRKTITRKRHPLLDDPLFHRFFGESIDEPRTQTQTSLGSGVIVSPQGYILTSNHVIEGADEIEVLLADGRDIIAEVVGTDSETDLAVLKIALDQLPSIVVGESDKLEVGDVVLAIGNPFGVGKTVTQGIVSATGRNQLGINSIENFIQTDAAINPGNSGGALISATGELIGINTAIYSKSGGSQGIGFAIPQALAENVLTQIIEHGHVVRGWLGVEAQSMPPQVAQSLGLKETGGVIISGIVQDSPAALAGIRSGDIITKLDDQTINSGREALNIIAGYRPGEKLVISGIRNGKTFEIEADIKQRPKFQ